MTHSNFPSLTGALAACAALVFSIAPASAQAQTHEHGASHAVAAASQDDPAALSTGEIKKVDKDTGKLTIKHGPLANLDMPAMTMAFKVQDPAMLAQVKAGDQIRFRVERINGAFAVTRLEAAN
jgi:Cu/Ag efflux protein CusF